MKGKKCQWIIPPAVKFCQESSGCENCEIYLKHKRELELIKQTGMLSYKFRSN